MPRPFGSLLDTPIGRTERRPRIADRADNREATVRLLVLQENGQVTLDRGQDTLINPRRNCALCLRFGIVHLANSPAMSEHRSSQRLVQSRNVQT